MNPEELLYCETHEWVHVDQQQQEATVGISAFAIEQLSDVVGLELPDVGQPVTAGEEFGVAESVKAVSPLYSPVSGVITAVNKSLEADFDAFNEDPYGRAWIIKVKLADDASLDGLKDYAAYQQQCAEEG